MKIVGDSIVDTVIEYANVRFGVELSVEHVSRQLKGKSLSQTLELVDAIKNDNSDLFSDIIDMSVEESGYGTAGTARQSTATVRAQNTAVDQANRTNKVASAVRGGGADRYTAGSNKAPTGTRTPVDPDDVQRQQNAAAAAGNAQEIDRLRDLINKVARR